MPSKRRRRPRAGPIPCSKSIGTTASPRRRDTSHAACGARRRRSPTARPGASCRRSCTRRTHRPAWAARSCCLSTLRALPSRSISGKHPNAPRRWGLGRLRGAPEGAGVGFRGSGGGRPQVRVVSLASNEPQVVTRAPAGVHDFAWRPDGGAIAYIASDTARAPTELGNDAFEVGNDDYLTTAPPAPAHLWLVSLATGAASRLTQGDWSVATSLATSPISWSADGRTIAFVRFATPHSGDTDQSAVWLRGAG